MQSALHVMTGRDCHMAPSESHATDCRTLGDVTAHQQSEQTLIVECGSAAVRITPMSDGIVRVRLAPSGSFGRDHSWAVISKDAAPNSWKLQEDDETLEVIGDSIRVRVQRRPCRISFWSADGKELCADEPSRGMTWTGEEIRCFKSLRDEDHFFGLGEKGCPLDKRDTAVLNWNHDSAEYEPYTDPLYQAHPFFILLNGGQAHGVFFDNTYRSFFDLGKTSRTSYSFGADGGELNYYFIPGPTPSDVIRRYSKLVGRPPLPPMWALGYQQCRWSYESAQRVQNITKQFRKRKIPCDAIYIDIDYMDGFRSFTWDPKRFAKPSAMLRSLAKAGMKVVVILDPGIKAEHGYSIYDDGIRSDHFCKSENGEPYIGKVWPGASVYPDFTRAATREWWGGLYRDLLDAGVTGIWNDMNEPADFTFSHGTVPLSVRHDNDGSPCDHRGVHNIYGMQMARSTYEGLMRLRPNQRPFVLTRAGYSGMQRFAATWTGDNRSSWDHLRMSIPMLLNMGLSGITLCGADIGGFRDYPSPELFTRWLQVGIFYPLCRVHTAGGREQDPWSFGKKHERINRNAIELRYQLMPYLYTEYEHATHTGLPVLRPLLLDFPDHPKVHRCEYEFLFGRQLYVAPVVLEGAKKRKVTLPAGTWYSFEKADPQTGGLEIELPVTIESIPMFAREGAIIPTRGVTQFAGQSALDELILHVFPGKGRGAFYHDDGTSFEYERGAYTLEEYEVETAGDVTTLRLTQRGGGERFAPRFYSIRFKGIRKPPLAVAAAGAPVPQYRTQKLLTKAAAGWFFDAKATTVWVRVPRLAVQECVELLRRTTPAAKGPRRSSRVRPSIV